MTSKLPKLHAAFVDRLRAAVEADRCFQALLVGGSFVHGGLDEHSDLDFVLVADEDAYERVMTARLDFAGKLGPLVSAFTGEHVGEPRLLICLYGPPLLHVDLKFVAASTLDRRIEQPSILFVRDGEALERSLAAAKPVWPNMTPEWFEARVWIWIHYAVTKLARGELYEALGMLAFFREQVLGPMLHRRGGQPQRGVRRVETFGLDSEGLLEATIATHDAASINHALRNAMSAYLALRADAPPAHTTNVASQALFNMLDAESDQRKWHA